MKRKGQANFINLLFLGMTFIVMLQLLPLINSAIASIPADTPPLMSTIIILAPALLFLAVIAMAYTYFFPRQQVSK